MADIPFGLANPPKAPWSPGWAAFRAALRLHSGQNWGFEEDFKYGVLVYSMPKLGSYSAPPIFNATAATGPFICVNITRAGTGPAHLPDGYFNSNRWQAIAWCQADDSVVVGPYAELRSDEFWRKRWAERHALPALETNAQQSTPEPEWWEGGRDPSEKARSHPRDDNQAS